MSGPDRRFDPTELHDLDGAPIADPDAASLLRVARDLEAYAQSQAITPTVGFEDRVMAAIATEAPPRPVATGGFLIGFITTLRDAWRITWSGGRPLAVRAQALALVLLVFVAVGSAGTLATVGVSRLLAGDPTAPPTIEPSVEPTTESPIPSTFEPSPSPSPSMSPSPSPSPGESADPGESGNPSETPGATDDNGGSNGTPEPTSTPRPSSKPSETPEPSDTPEPSRTPQPSDTPEPSDSETPHAGDTPKPSDDSSGSGSGGTDGS